MSSTPPTWPWPWYSTIGRLIALLVLIVCIIALIVPVSVPHLEVWLILALAVALLFG